MPYLNPDNFEIVRKALLATQGMCESALPQFDWGKSRLDCDAIQSLNETPGEVRKAIYVMAEALTAAAPEDLREAASGIHANDECEIDDDAAMSQGDDGAWVQAWVYVPGWGTEDEDAYCTTCYNAIETRPVPCDECGVMDEEG